MADARRLEDPDEILDYLSPVIRVLDDAIDSGISVADDFFSGRGRSSDPHVWSTIVRYGACQRLADSEPDGWQWQQLPFCGIQVAREPLILRVLKAQNGDAPHPGKSVRRRGYYLQQGLMLPLDFAGIVMPSVSNLLFDWQVNGERERTYHLSKPSGTWEYGQPSMLEWRRHVEINDNAMRFVGAEEIGLLVDTVIEADELQDCEA